MYVFITSDIGTCTVLTNLHSNKSPYSIGWPNHLTETEVCMGYSYAMNN